MNQRPSRRSILSTACATISILFAGCYDGYLSNSGDQSLTEVPILVENNDDTEHEVFVEIGSSSDDHDTTVTVDPNEKIEATTAEGSFCIRAYARTLDNMKDVTCPAPDESDYSESGYIVALYSSEDTGNANQRIRIESAD